MTPRGAQVRRGFEVTANARSGVRPQIFGRRPGSGDENNAPLDHFVGPRARAAAKMSVALQTAEQTAARAIFGRAVAALLAAMTQLGRDRRGLTELVILLLLYPLADRDRRRVLADVQSTIGRVH